MTAASLPIGQEFGIGPNRQKPLNVHTTTSRCLTGILIHLLRAFRAGQNPTGFYDPFPEFRLRAVAALPPTARAASVVEGIHRAKGYGADVRQRVILRPAVPPFLVCPLTEFGPIGSMSVRRRLAICRKRDGDPLAAPSLFLYRGGERRLGILAVHSPPLPPSRLAAPVESSNFSLTPPRSQPRRRKRQPARATAGPAVSGGRPPWIPTGGSGPWTWEKSCPDPNWVRLLQHSGLKTASHLTCRGHFGLRPEQREIGRI